MDRTADMDGGPPTLTRSAVVLNAPSSAAATTNASQPHATSATSDSQQQYVDHTYKDYAKVDRDDLALVTGLAEDEATKDLLTMEVCYGPGRTKRHCGSALLPFPAKLLDVLDRSDLSTIIDWMPHGRAFVVKQPKLLAAQILPRFFKQTKYLSFTRQLNLWGFRRITRGMDAGAYYHPLFLPGRPHLTMRMKRIKIKGTGVRLSPDPSKEPNFYRDFEAVSRPPARNPGPLPPLPSERFASIASHTVPTVRDILQKDEASRRGASAGAAAVSDYDCIVGQEESIRSSIQAGLRNLFLVAQRPVLPTPAAAPVVHQSRDLSAELVHGRHAESLNLSPPLPADSLPASRQLASSISPSSGFCHSQIFEANARSLDDARQKSLLEALGAQQRQRSFGPVALNKPSSSLGTPHHEIKHRNAPLAASPHLSSAGAQVRSPSSLELLTNVAIEEARQLEEIARTQRTTALSIQMSIQMSIRRQEEINRYLAMRKYLDGEESCLPTLP